MELLTELDDDTARLFPSLAGAVEPPTGTGVEAAAERLARGARAARARGEDVVFYFVFAGHGDVDAGRGFLELADGPFYAGDLQRLLADFPADASHVILDSCNSFFVLNPRKPGGRRFSTPRDTARQLSQRLPRVGVFLSTSAEEEVYEWSALQSGIFSHAVRSGLSGAADVDGDGAVGYDELEAFVQVAASRVANPLYRPKVFARGPGGSRDAELLQLPAQRAATLTIEEERPLRLSVRDADELRWIDLYKEEGASVTLHLPPRLAGEMAVEELEVRKGEGVVVRRWERAAGGGDAPIRLAALTETEIPAAARGAADLFRKLFAAPFGPRAYDRYRAQRDEAPPPVFGISREDSIRMKLLLEQTAGVDRQQRFFKAGALIGGSALSLSGGLYAALTAKDAEFFPEREQRWIGLSMAGSGATGLVIGSLLALEPPGGERAYQAFRRDLKDPSIGAARAVANAERRLLEMRRRDRRFRRALEVAGWSWAGLNALGLAANELVGPERYRAGGRALLAAGVIGGAGAALITRYNVTPVERMVDIWQRDPGIQRLPRIGIAPTRDGLALSLGGTF